MRDIEIYFVQIKYIDRRIYSFYKVGINEEGMLLFFGYNSQVVQRVLYSYIVVIGYGGEKKILSIIK